MENIEEEKAGETQNNLSARNFNNENPLSEVLFFFYSGTYRSC